MFEYKNFRKVTYWKVIGLAKSRFDSFYSVKTTYFEICAFLKLGSSQFQVNLFISEVQIVSLTVDDKIEIVCISRENYAYFSSTNICRPF